MFPTSDIRAPAIFWRHVAGAAAPFVVTIIAWGWILPAVLPPFQCYHPTWAGLGVLAVLCLVWAVASGCLWRAGRISGETLRGILIGLTLAVTPFVIIPVTCWLVAPLDGNPRPW